MSTSTPFTKYLQERLAGLVEVTGEQLAQLESHYSLLLKWNSSMNLTTVTGMEEAAVRHYGESLLLGNAISGQAIVDIGTGPGFPGIPIAILHPEWEVTLVESHRRKAVFLREAARGLRNVRVAASRAEDVADRFDWVVSRAVDPAFVLGLRIAPRFGLLIGSEDASKLGSAQITQLPWGHTRVIAIGNYPDQCST